MTSYANLIMMSGVLYVVAWVVWGGMALFLTATSPSLSEARVYCQDSNASPWVPLGFTCPVVCQNIVSAIERLKNNDFRSLINQHPGSKTVPYNNIPLLNKDNIISNHIDVTFDTDLKEKDRHGRMDGVNDFKIANESINEILHKDVVELTQKVKTVSVGCARYRKVGFIRKLKTCARRSSYDPSFLSIMTNLLNKYVKSKYKFTADMTEVLLEKIIGKNADLRNDIPDVNNLLTYLRAAMHLHKEHVNPDKISLKSKNCLTISLPGCFCKPGFVESSGQCVKPTDCVDESIHAYLSRIVVL